MILPSNRQCGWWGPGPGASHWSADKSWVVTQRRPRPPVSHPITAWNRTSKTPEPIEAPSPTVCRVWRQRRVCLGRRWMFEQDGRVLPALYWQLGSMLNLRRDSTACSFSGGLYPVCCRFTSVCISSSSTRICFVDLAWTPNLVPWGGSWSECGNRSQIKTWVSLLWTRTQVAPYLGYCLWCGIGFKHSNQIIIWSPEQKEISL